MKKSGIYALVNVANGKRYVGQSIDLDRRRCDHFASLRGGYCRNVHLQRAFSGYGEHEFEWRILEECELDMLDVRERTWISYYNSTDAQNGYNLEFGGNLKKIVSKESRAKLSAALMGTQRAKGHRLSMEARKKISDAKKGKPQSEESNRRRSLSSLGRKMSAETRAKMSAAQKNRVMSSKEMERLRLLGYSHRGKPSWNKGIPFSEEARREMSLAKKGKPWTEARRNAMLTIVRNDSSGMITDGAKEHAVG